MINQLIQFIEQHGHQAKQVGNQLLVQSYYVNSTTNKAGIDSKLINPTWKAVKDWLGY